MSRAFASWDHLGHPVPILVTVRPALHRLWPSPSLRANGTPLSQFPCDAQPVTSQRYIRVWWGEQPWVVNIHNRRTIALLFLSPLPVLQVWNCRGGSKWGHCHAAVQGECTPPSSACAHGCPRVRRAYAAARVALAWLPLANLELVAASVRMNVHTSPLILFRPLRPRDTHSHTQVGVRLLAEIDEKLALSELPPS